MPKYVSMGKRGVVNQRMGALPGPRCRILKLVSSSSEFPAAAIFACFLSKELKVVSLRPLPSSSSSESDESDPDKLSSRSDRTLVQAV